MALDVGDRVVEPVHAFDEGVAEIRDRREIVGTHPGLVDHRAHQGRLLAQVPRTVAGARAVGHAAVERHSDDADVDAVPLLRLFEEPAAHEGRDPGVARLVLLAPRLPALLRDLRRACISIRFAAHRNSSSTFPGGLAISARSPAQDDGALHQCRVREQQVDDPRGGGAVVRAEAERLDAAVLAHQVARRVRDQRQYAGEVFARRRRLQVLHDLEAGAAAAQDLQGAAGLAACGVVVDADRVHPWPSRCGGGEYSAGRASAPPVTIAVSNSHFARRVPRQDRHDRRSAPDLPRTESQGEDGLRSSG